VVARKEDFPLWFYLLPWLILVGLWFFTTPAPYLAWAIYHLIRGLLLLISWPFRRSGRR
jgi:hypothetical protein